MELRELLQQPNSQRLRDTPIWPVELVHDTVPLLVLLPAQTRIRLHPLQSEKKVDPIRSTQFQARLGLQEPRALYLLPRRRFLVLSLLHSTPSPQTILPTHQHGSIVSQSRCIDT